MKNNKRRCFDKSLLPKVIDYYTQQFTQLKIKPEWTSVCCPFHEDHKPSLSLNLQTGGFFCFGCQARGGDIIDFHRRRYRLNFIETVNFFGAWRDA